MGRAEQKSTARIHERIKNEYCAGGSLSLCSTHVAHMKKFRSGRKLRGGSKKHMW